MKTILPIFFAIALSQGISSIEAQAVTDKVKIKSQGAVSQVKQSKQNIFEQAGAKYQAKDLQGTIADCDRAIKISPNFPEAYWLRYLAKATVEDKTSMLDKEQYYTLSNKRIQQEKSSSIAPSVPATK
jgi:outer membrane protein assembly factor BamD (BamD/ComL family)